MVPLEIPKTSERSLHISGNSSEEPTTRNHFDSKLEFGSTSLKEMETASKIVIKDVLIKKKTLFEPQPEMLIDRQQTLTLPEQAKSLKSRRESADASSVDPFVFNTRNSFTNESRCKTRQDF